MLKSDEDEEDRISVNRFHQSYPGGPAATAGIYLSNLTIANLQVSRCLQVPGRLETPKRLETPRRLATAPTAKELYSGGYVSFQMPRCLEAGAWT